MNINQNIGPNFGFERNGDEEKEKKVTGFTVGSRDGSVTYQLKYGTRVGPEITTQYEASDTQAVGKLLRELRKKYNLPDERVNH